jgi:hypothetical protein
LFFPPTHNLVSTLPGGYQLVHSFHIFYARCAPKAAVDGSIAIYLELSRCFMATVNS